MSLGFIVYYGLVFQQNSLLLTVLAAHLACMPSIRRMAKDNSVIFYLNLDFKKFIIFFKLQINLRDLGQLYKIRIGHDNTGNDPSWYLEEVRLEREVPLSYEEICLPIESWLSEDKDEGDTWREVAIRNPAGKLLPCTCSVF